MNDFKCITCDPHTPETLGENGPADQFHFACHCGAKIKWENSLSISVGEGLFRFTCPICQHTHEVNLAGWVCKNAEAQPNLKHFPNKSYLCIVNGKWSCGWCGENLVEKDMATKPPLTNVTSQKAKSLTYLSNVVHGSQIEALKHVIYKASDLADKKKKLVDILNKKFARPCPTRPRHGFVGSRVVNNITELRALAKTVVNVEPEAELALCAPIEATHNAIWSNGSLVVGPGNEGATSGHESLTFPTVPVQPFSFNRDKVGLKVEDSPFFEFVYKQEYCWLTQVRGGPMIEPGSLDFIPREIKVTEVKTIHFDPETTDPDELVAWEKWGEENKGKPGLVVYHPGGAIYNHFGIHCFLNDIPYIVTREPHIGDKLKVIGKKKKPANKFAFAMGYRYGLLHPTLINWGGGVGNPVQWIEGALYFLHNSSQLHLNRPVQAMFFGACCGAVVRLGIAACAGEARHASHRAGGSSRAVLKPISGTDRSREGIYQYTTSAAFGGPTRLDARQYMVDQKAWLEQSLWIYENLKWEGGYGGPKWANCCRAVGELHNACGVKNVKKAISALNKVINVSHNGSLLLTKFTGSTEPFSAWQGAPSLRACRRGQWLYQLLIDGLFKCGIADLAIPLKIVKTAESMKGKEPPMGWGDSLTKKELSTYDSDSDDDDDEEEDSGDSSCTCYECTGTTPEDDLIVTKVPMKGKSTGKLPTKHPAKIVEPVAKLLTGIHIRMTELLDKGNTSIHFQTKVAGCPQYVPFDLPTNITNGMYEWAQAHVGKPTKASEGLSKSWAGGSVAGYINLMYDADKEVFTLQDGTLITNWEVVKNSINEKASKYTPTGVKLS